MYNGTVVDSSWNVIAHGDAREEKWRGNKRMEWVTSKRHMTAEHRLARAVQTMQADARTLAASSRLNWRPRRFKLTRPFHRKTKSHFCACSITFQRQSTNIPEQAAVSIFRAFWKTLKMKTASQKLWTHIPIYMAPPTRWLQSLSEQLWETKVYNYLFNFI